MVTLNVGCGSTDWGDVRLDASRVYHGRKTMANIIADASCLPFKDNVFEEVRAHHILEHLKNWQQAIEEWCRVSKKVDIIIPVDPGFLRKAFWMQLTYFQAYLGSTFIVSSFYHREERNIYGRFRVI